MPPIEASATTDSRARSRSAPMSNSRLASRPTTRKKNAIRPSLTHSRRSSEIPPSPIWIDTVVAQKES